ncbi:MAG TPA: FtsX-like permease family protein, partial [Candidatus Krumholzibacterium sp.]|nr:FtsX-like permease family protein [Candidatus Krumholzibacterium sp.]
IADVQYALDMDDSAGEILGLFPNLIFDERRAAEIAEDFNGSVEDPSGELSPVMLTLLEQAGLGEFMELIDFRMVLVLVTFFFVMSLVLWNAGLRGGIRRYGEVGVRLAIGESKGHVYWLLVAESFLIGLAGSIVGTGIGLLVSLYFQEVGVDYSSFMRGSQVLMSNVMRARITTTSWYIGFLPGVLATLTGSAFSGVGIFRRQTAQLFKELET